MRRGGVVGAGAAGVTRSDALPAGDAGLVGESDVGKYCPVSWKDESDNSPYLSNGNLFNANGAGGSDIVKLKVLEYLRELQRMMGYPRIDDAISAMYATLAALGDADAVRGADEFLMKVADGLPGHIYAEDAVHGVFAVLIPRISNGEIEDLTAGLPEELWDAGIRKRSIAAGYTR